MKRLVVVLLVACIAHTHAAGQKSQKSQRPQVQTPATFRGDTVTQPDAQSLANYKWFELFQDQKLQQLINDALAHNYDLREAVARIDAARANLGITRSQQYPQIYASGDVLNTRSSRSAEVELPEPIQRDRSF